MFSMLKKAFGQGQEISYGGRMFRLGSRVKLRNRSGTLRPEKTGYSREVWRGPGQCGTIEGFEASGSNGEPRALVHWDEATWAVDSTGRYERLRSFKCSLFLEEFVFENEPVDLVNGKDGPFSSGDRIVFSRRSGLFLPGAISDIPEIEDPENGVAIDQAWKKGATGTVVGAKLTFSTEDPALIAVLWDAQEWAIYHVERGDDGRRINLPSFDCTTHPDNVKKL